MCRLNSGSEIEELEARLLKLRMDLMRDKMEMLEADAALELIKTEAVYESQQLRVLVASTRPLEHGERKTDRDKSVAQLSQESTKTVFDAVRRSVERQNLIMESADEMTRSVDIFYLDQERRQHRRIDHLNSKFTAYVDNLKEIVQRSEEKLKNVTSQYLILRHNARIARELLVQSQNNLKIEKEQIIARVRQLRDDVREQLSLGEEKCESQMSAVISQRRTELLKREEELEHSWASLEELRNFHAADNRNLKQAYKVEKKKYNELMRRRTSDLTTIESELKTLRRAVADAEISALSRPVTSASNNAAIPQTFHRLNSLSEEELLGLNDRLINLKRDFVKRAF